MEPKTEITHITTPVAKYTLDFNTGFIKAKPIITHGDSVRSMTDEELADMFTDIGVRTLRLHKLPVVELVIEQTKEDWLD